MDPIEIVARAIHHDDDGCGGGWHELPEMHQRKHNKAFYRSASRAAIKSLEAAGWRLVRVNEEIPIRQISAEVIESTRLNALIDLPLYGQPAKETT